MTRLTHKVSGHELTTDDASVEFWKSAGYVEAEAPAPKTPAKKATSRKSTTK